jgi:hypothetical protein
LAACVLKGSPDFMFDGIDELQIGSAFSGQNSHRSQDRQDAGFLTMG